MVLLGISILAVSLSFLFYRHPPTWSFLSWLRQPSIQDVGNRDQHAPGALTNHDRQSEPKEIPRITKEEPQKELDKSDIDRRMMPPPTLPPKKPISPTTPQASATSKATPIPSFNLSDSASNTNPPSKPATDISNPQPPLFPAANSAQRAGSTNQARPPASFPALNSAQRASPGTNAAPRLPAPGSMAPPSVPRSSLPNRGPPNSLAPPPTHTSIPSKPSKKVLLTPGHSPLDWARLTSTNPTLNGLPSNSPYLRVPPSLLKTMTGRKGKDAWTSLGGKVYNISPYAAYHPGGVPELMKAAGRDGTRLFGEIHPWVNWEGMLEGCLVGIAVDEGEVKGGGGGLEDMD